MDHRLGPLWWGFWILCVFVSHCIGTHVVCMPGLVSSANINRMDGDQKNRAGSGHHPAWWPRCRETLKGPGQLFLAVTDLGQ